MSRALVRLRFGIRSLIYRGLDHIHKLKDRRYMDDVIVLAKTRWHLRKAVRTVNQHFNQLNVEQAPDKTFIGRIEKGFDFLGYRFGLPELGLAEKTITNAVNKVRQPTLFI